MNIKANSVVNRVIGGIVTIFIAVFFFKLDFFTSMEYSVRRFLVVLDSCGNIRNRNFLDCGEERCIY